MTAQTREENIDLSPMDRAEVLRILKAHLPGFEVWVFGSRVQGTARTYSDLDLAVITQRPLPLEIMADLKEAFDQSDLTIKVDVVDWATTGDAFRRIIQGKKVVLQNAATEAGTE